MPQTFADQFRAIPMSPNLGESLERAHRFARDQGHRSVTLEHLLLAFTEDPDASAVLQASTVDLDRLGTDVSGYLGRLLEDMRGEEGADPQTDTELMRVLHAAVQAAQQSRRRHIDGAIVLAAMVGDGKSPAAGLLKAHGLTFEEAIRALQKANAKATAQARSKQFATPPGPSPAPAAPAAPSARNGAAPVDKPPTSLEPLNVREPQATGQSVDDILAAARARIQQRTSAIVGKAPEQTPPSPPPAPDPEPLPLSRLEPTLAPPTPPLPEPHAQEAEETAAPAPPPAKAPPRPAPPAPPRAKDNNWMPPAAPAPPVPGPPPARLPPVRPHAQAAPPQRLPPGGEVPPRLPPAPVQAGGTNPGAEPRLPGRPMHAPWPEPNDAPAPRARPAVNGAHAPAPTPGARRPGQRTGGGAGPLVETIPRRMRLGVASQAQVRIARDKVDGLIVLLSRGRGMTHRPDAFLTRALSVRLQAPDGGFSIEAASPETQWIDNAPGLSQDDHIGWRWTVTPKRRGRGRLVLVVTARTVGADGLAAEMAPPDRTIEVAVAGGGLGRLVRWSGILTVLILGVIIGRLGGELWALGLAIIRKVLG